MPSSRLPWLASCLQGFGTTIFAEMTRLAELDEGLRRLHEPRPR